MTTSHQEQLKQEFKEKFGCKEPNCCDGLQMQDHYTVDEIADFWLQKIDEAVQKARIEWETNVNNKLNVIEDTLAETREVREETREIVAETSEIYRSTLR